MIFLFLALSLVITGLVNELRSSSSQLGWSIINLTATPLINFALISITLLRLFSKTKFIKS